MSNVWKRAHGAMARAAMWLPFLLGVAVTLTPVVHGQTTGLPAPMSGDCVTSGVGSVVCTKTNGAPFGSPGAYAKGFAGSQNHLWLLTEGAGNVASDYFGSAPATSAGSFTWSQDGGLSFNGGYANRAVATNASSLQTMEVVMVSSMPLGTQTIMPMAYGGVAAASASQTLSGIILHENWQYIVGGTTPPASLPTYAGYYLAYNTYPPTLQGSTTSAVQGVHVIDFQGGPGQPWLVYVDGQPVTNLYNSYSDLNPTTINGGYIEFGGSPLGYVNCSSATCGFSGTIYGAATYSTRLTQAQIQQNVTNWMRNVLPAKGVNTTQSTYTNNGNGAQGTAGKAVNMVSFGESITWGHGLNSPASQSYSAVAANTINGGNAFGFGFGYDSRSEYVMHKSLNALEAMYSPNATNVAVLFSNSNDCRYSSGSAPQIQTYSSNVPAQAARDLITDALELQSKGWAVLIGTGLSGTPNFGTGDGAKDSCNPVLRQRALSVGIPLWDIANDPRVGADGAYTASSGTACGGSACYQSDNLHPSQAGEAVMGANLATRVNALLYPAPVTSTAATYTMTGTEAPLMVNPSLLGTGTSTTTIGGVGGGGGTTGGQQGISVVFLQPAPQGSTLSKIQVGFANTPTEGDTLPITIFSGSNNNFTKVTSFNATVHAVAGVQTLTAGTDFPAQAITGSNWVIAFTNTATLLPDGNTDAGGSLYDYLLVPITSNTQTWNTNGNDVPRFAATFTLPGSGSATQTVTLPDCIGFTGTAFSVSNLQTSGSNAVTIVPAQSAETMNGLGSYVLSNAATATFKAIPGADTTGGCSWQMR